MIERREHRWIRPIRNGAYDLSRPRRCEDCGLVNQADLAALQGLAKWVVVGAHCDDGQHDGDIERLVYPPEIESAIYATRFCPEPYSCRCQKEVRREAAS